MEKIIQLKSSEYDELYEKAKLNEKEIEKRAEELYQEKGTYEIKLGISTEYSYDVLSFRANAWGDNGWGKKKEISFADGRKFITFIQNAAQKSAERKFGEQINDSKIFASDVKKLKNLTKVFKLVTITGWIVSILMFILLMSK